MMPARDQNIPAIKQGLQELIKLIDQEADEPEHQGATDLSIPNPVNMANKIATHLKPPGVDLGWRSPRFTRDINEQPPHARQAAGTLLMAPDGRALFLRRAQGRDHGGQWSIPAGMTEGDEAPWQTALRETHEEVGDCGINRDSIQLMDHSFDNGQGFTTYGARVGDAFRPQLNDEHDNHQWSSMTTPPQPLHPGLKRTLDFAMDPLTNKGQKIMSSMKSQYGPEKGEEVFYASANKGNITGVHGDAGASAPMNPQASPTPFGANINDAPPGTHDPGRNPLWTSPKWTDQTAQAQPGPVQGAPQGQPGINPDDQYSHTFTRKRDYPDGTSDQHVTKWTSPKLPGQGGSQDNGGGGGGLAPPPAKPINPPPPQMQPLGAQKLQPRQNDAAAGWHSPRFG